ncbi:MAG: hypothetical protein AAGB93_12030 [Planctomycetota bacterium]
MPPLLKRFSVLALCVLVAWYAHSPLLGAGFLGSDAAVLDDIDRAYEEGGGTAPWSVDAVDHRPLASTALAISRSIHARGGIYTPGDAGRVRLDSLLMLVVAAFGVRSVVIRSMRPWTGDDHARAAGAAAGAFLMVHPLLVPVVAHLPSRGDVVGLAASAWSVAFLLRGRQSRNAVQLGAAFVLAVVAAASSPAAILLVPLGFGLEFIAAYRHRPRPVRIRTGLRVAFGYAAALALEASVRLACRPGGPIEADPPPVDPSQVLVGVDSGLARSLAIAAEKTGVVVLPVNTTGVGTIGYALGVLALLAALHPGFVAARAAPRLWGRLLGGWAIALVVLLVLGSRERAIPASLGDAPGTLSLAVCMAVGLGISSTALSGARRTVLPILTGCLYALLTAGSGATIQEAAAQVGALHQAVLDAGREDDWSRSVVALDPPRVVAGVRALAPEDDVSLVSAPFVPRGSEPVEMRGVESASFWALIGEPEFRALREHGVTVLLPPERVLRPEPIPGGRDDDRVATDVVRRAVRVPRPRPATSLGDAGEFGWVGEGAAPARRRFDPLDAAAMVAVAPPAAANGAPLAAAPVVRWTGSSELGVDGSSRGVWLRGPDGTLEVAFHVGDEPEWLMAGEVKSVWFTGELRQASAVRVLRAPRSLPAGVSPRVVGDDWSFDLAAADLAEPAHGVVEEWVLWVVDPQSGAYVQLAPRGAATRRLTAVGAAALHDLDLLWILDRRLDGVTVERARGRRGG